MILKKDVHLKEKSSNAIKNFYSISTFYSQIKLLYQEKKKSNWIYTKATILLIRQLLLDICFQIKV